MDVGMFGELCCELDYELYVRCGEWVVDCDCFVLLVDVGVVVGDVEVVEE